MGKTKSISAEQAEANRKWWIVDAKGQTLGRLATQVAAIIRGKNKVTFTPHVDCGDSVVVINAKEIVVTGAKEKDKVYYQHTGFIGSVKEHTLGELRKTRPETIIEEAVYGMLPKGVLGKQSMRRRLRVFSGADHAHTAQMPQPYAIENVK
jgi:large subunit ribosomal protein L13